uniref:Surfeit locus protein 2 n=1 Tax=Ciona savignyi TaxID=51511 RepID=H2YEI5_CIOSA
MSNDLPEKIKDLMKQHPALVVTENGRIKCTVTNHEMMCHYDSVLQHVTGKKYRRLTKELTEKFDFTKYEPHLVPSHKKGYEHQLFCTLTLRHLNKLPSHVTKHVEGRRYKRAIARWEECVKNGEKFVPMPMLQRHKHFDENDNEKMSPMANGDESDTDSFSDLYPEKYFDKLKLSSDEEKTEIKMDVKTKKKKKAKNPRNNSKKRKNPLVELSSKRKKLNENDKKDSNLITFA